LASYNSAVPAGALRSAYVRSPLAWLVVRDNVTGKIGSVTAPLTVN